ncbi:HPr(Ser) kinase/phosphatase [Fusobacterium perfoetens]|uniref:HPr(Ser) kinase/phosphatase n=1 Tax=Fusobacterium perfoetens TaxID=852 RepID=UPI001F213F41|nr:HPr(Ser) kinase/phosphatase [Fusobacterium perfoetens]MCF2625075.1 HPr(Ser) kinase/phosphatase [Fusobacterium perfoetens]
MELNEKRVTLKQIIKHFNLEVLADGDLEQALHKNEIYRSGYELTGFFSKDALELKTAIHVMGARESRYLSRICPTEKRKILEKYFSYPFPAMVLSSQVADHKLLLEVAKEKKKVILKCNMRATKFIRELNFYLKNALGREGMLDEHIFLEVYGIGILLRGPDELKIGATVELLERGHKFITDARLNLKETESGLSGMNSKAELVPEKDYFLEMQGEENINITNYFGIKSTRPVKKVDMIIELEIWQEKKFYDRLGIDDIREDILGYKLPKITLPARKGRNLAVIIETAAINYRLKAMGVNSARYFMEESKKLIEKNKERRERGEAVGEDSLSVKMFAEENRLEILIGEEIADERFLKDTSIHRPALALSGYFDLDEAPYENNGLQIFTIVEVKYLNSLDKETRIRNLEKFFSYKFPAIIICGKMEVPKYIIELVEKTGKVLLKSEEEIPSLIIAKLNTYLEQHFAPSVSMHGVFVEMYGFGVLLTGKSGIGKSETALELIHRGHRLIADDMVKFKKRTNGDIVGRAANLPYFMEIRGLGIIDIKTLYGLGAVRIKKRLDAVIEIKEQTTENYLTSINYMSSKAVILDKEVYKAELYMSSGRNAAAMVEIVVMNLMAKRLGHNAEHAYNDGLSRMTEEEKREIFSDDF